MATFKEMKDKYYQEEGYNALENRLKAIYAIWKEMPAEKYPLRFQMFGFPPLELASKEQTEGHIKELEQILMVSISEERVN